MSYCTTSQKVLKPNVVPTATLLRSLVAVTLVSEDHKSGLLG